MNDMRVHAIILAHQKSGDFWASAYPSTLRYKNFDNIQSQSLLEVTIERISNYIPHQRRWVATTIEQEAVVVEKVGSAIAGVLIEPEEQGGLASMLFSALLIHESDPEAVLLFLPSTHQVTQPEKFSALIEHVVHMAYEQQKIVLMGIQPLYVTQDYNYLAYDGARGAPGKFTGLHKISLEEQLTYMSQDKNYVWNSGIVAAPAETFITAIEKAAPEVYASVHTYVQGLGEYRESVASSFENVLSAMHDLVVFPVDCIWQDMGAISRSMADNLEVAAVLSDNYIEIDSRNNLIEAEGNLVALIGVENLCVIKKDDIVLVVHRDHMQKVKQVIDELKKGREKYL